MCSWRALQVFGENFYSFQRIYRIEYVCYIYIDLTCIYAFVNMFENKFMRLKTALAWCINTRTHTAYTFGLALLGPFTWSKFHGILSSKIKIYISKNTRTRNAWTRHGIEWKFSLFAVFLGIWCMYNMTGWINFLFNTLFNHIITLLLVYI